MSFIFTVDALQMSLSPIKCATWGSESWQLLSESCQEQCELCPGSDMTYVTDHPEHFHGSPRP